MGMDEPQPAQGLAAQGKGVEVGDKDAVGVADNDVGDGAAAGYKNAELPAEL